MKGKGQDSVEALPESKLGTKEYWDSTYKRELDTYGEIGDEGEIWFGEEAVERMVDYIEEERVEGSNVIPDNASVLDLGTGNGHLLFALSELQPILTSPSRMLGVDYSEGSIDLAKAIGKKRGHPFDQVQFEVHDFLQEDHHSTLGYRGQGWDLLCDKGTLDAIALSESKSHDPIHRYSRSVRELCKPGGLFVITSCNFTEAELKSIFSDQGFQVHHIVPTPSFSFGGQKGSTTTTIAFKRG